jgi:hypothetical protein
MATYDLMYTGYVETLSIRICNELERIESVFSFDLGPEFGIALCVVLSEILPERFGICRGFIVHRDGRYRGDDIIVYDRLMFPSLRALPGAAFARKEKIPIEAVYAYIECKHTLILENDAEAASLGKASNQVSQAKALCAERDRVAYGQSDPYLLRTSEIDRGPRWLPPYRNPPFGMIISRRVALKSTAHIMNDPSEIHEILLKGTDIKDNGAVVDVVVAGPDNVMAPSYLDEDGLQQHAFFMLPEEKNGLSCFKTPGLAFGVGVTHLLAVLDWIHLGRLPWEDMLSQSQNVCRKPGVASESW